AIGLAQMPIKKLNNAHLKLKIAEAAVERVYGLLESPDSEPAVKSGGTSARRVQLRDAVRFEDVFLRYGDKTALDGVSFEVRRGEVAAFVGTSGSGKTSIVNLLPRLYDVTGGRITLDGTDIRELDLGELRQLISFVTQDTFLFNDTIFEN